MDVASLVAKFEALSTVARKCQVCSEPIPPAHGAVLAEHFPCWAQHSTCIGCALEWTRHQVRSGSTQLRCAKNCTTFTTDIALASFFKAAVAHIPDTAKSAQELLALFQTRQFLKALGSKLRFCPNARCSAPFLFEGPVLRRGLAAVAPAPSQAERPPTPPPLPPWTPPPAPAAASASSAAETCFRDSVCIECQHHFCALCLGEPHPALSCEEQDRAADKLGLGTTIHFATLYTKDCPRCGWAIEKNGGCAQMTCMQCSHKFCWTCFDDFEHGNPHTGCYDRMIFEQSELATRIEQEAQLRHQREQELVQRQARAALAHFKAVNAQKTAKKLSRRRRRAHAQRATRL